MAQYPYHKLVLDALVECGVCSQQQLADVQALLPSLSGQCALDGPQIWRHVANHILLPSHDFAVHLRLAAVVYDGWPSDTLGRPPLWLPEEASANATNIARFLETIRDEPWWQPAAQWSAAAAGSEAGGSLSPLQAAAACLGPRCCELLGAWRRLQAASWELPEAFWRPVLRALGVQFEVPPERILQRHPTDPDQCRWLPGARLNAAAAALSSPLAPPGSPALLWARDGAPTQIETVSQEELGHRVRHLAACIRRRFAPGDAVALYLPMGPEAVCLYLATVLAGCVVVSVADSFSGAELRTRLDIAGAVGVFTQDVVLRGGKALPLYDKVVQSDTRAVAVVLPASGGAGLSPSCPPLRPGDLPWSAFRDMAGPAEAANLQPHVADAYEMTNILFSSGTTGEPKALPWTHLTPLRCALDGWSLLDVRPGSVVCWPTSMGWMMGPWLLYATLMNGGTVALYGGAPLGRDFLRFVSAARVDVLGLVPSIVRAWRLGGGGEGGGGGEVDLSCVRVFGSTGEASSAEDYHWLMSRARGYRPVVEYCGGTEIGGAYVSSTPLHPCAPATFNTASLGARLVLLGGPQGGPAGGGGGEEGGASIVWDGTLLGAAARAGSPGGGVGGVAGEVALAAPSLGLSQRLLNKDHYGVYYAGMPRYGTTGLPLRRHGDEMAALPALGPGPGPWAFCALGRCDDTMNLGGIKVSSVELERAVVEAVPGVAEAAAVGVAPPGGGPEELHLFLVLKRAGLQRPGPAGGAASEQQPVMRELAWQCQEALRTKLNPLFKLNRVAVVPSLPRNASNKVMRRLLRDSVPARARL